MLGAIWEFLKDETNRAVLGVVGGAIVAVAAGIAWVVRTFFNKKSESSCATSRVSADRGGVAAGRDITAPVNTNACDLGTR